MSIGMGASIGGGLIVTPFCVDCSGGGGGSPFPWNKTYTVDDASPGAPPPACATCPTMSTPLPCDCQSTADCPVPVPGPGSPYELQSVIVTGNGTALGGVPVTCTETGVTMATSCVDLGATGTFYFTTTGTKHFTAPAGSYSKCEPHVPPCNAGSGSGSAGVPGSSGCTIGLTCS